MTIKFNNVYVKDAATVAGKLESEGPLKKYFDKTYDDFYMQKNTILSYSLETTHIIMIYSLVYQAFPLL